MSGKYDDIIHLPHHVSAVHPHMSLHDRAAQFAPFSPLSVHGRAILETVEQARADIAQEETGIPLDEAERNEP